MLPGQREMHRSADGWTPGGFRLGIPFGLGVREWLIEFVCSPFLFVSPFLFTNFIPLTSSVYGVFTMMYPYLILFDLLAAIYHDSLLLSICYVFRPQICLPHTMLWRPLIPSGAGTMLLVSNDQLMPDQNAPDAKAGVFFRKIFKHIQTTIRGSTSSVLKLT